MTDATQEQLYTFADLQAMPEDGNTYELHDGELRIMPTASYGHSLLTMQLAALLFTFCKLHKLGHVLGDHAGFRLHIDPVTGRETVRIPDVSFIQLSRIPADMTHAYEGAPDLAVEVISPSETYKSIQEKLADYFTYGVQMVWLIHPDRRQVEAYTTLDQKTTLKESDMLEGGTVLPGFTLKLADLFAVLI